MKTKVNAVGQVSNQPKPDPRSKRIRSFKHWKRKTPSPEIERAKKVAPPKSLRPCKPQSSPTQKVVPS